MNAESVVSEKEQVSLSSAVDESLGKMLSIIRRHLGMDVAFFSEFIDGQRVFKAVDQSDIALPNIHVGDSDPLDETYCAKIAQGELSKVIHDCGSNDVTSKLAVTKNLNIGSYMGVPIELSDGATYGTLCCYKRKADGALNQRDLNFLTACAEIYRDLFEDRVKDTNALQEVSQRIQLALEQNIMSIHYQPIYNLDSNTVSGYESLARFNTEPYRTPDVWFFEAGSVGLGEQLELNAIDKALSNMHYFDSSIYLSINVSPDFVLNGSVCKVLSKFDLERLVLEITEHSPIQEYDKFRQLLEPLRKKGLRLAVDDAGAGYASFQHVLELEADIIKLDLSLIRDIHLDIKKYALAKALCAFAKATKCMVIAEGVEAREELNVLRELGVDRAQGYLIGKPLPLNDALRVKPTL